MRQRDPHVSFAQVSNTEDADQVSVSGKQAHFGQGGSDHLTFSGTSPFSPGLALGGQGSDTYVVNAGENGVVFDGFGSSGDRLETPGLSFQNALAAQIDGRHLWVGSSDSGTNVVILDWRDSDHRVESFSFSDGQSLSYAQATTAIDSGIEGYLGDFSLEQALSQAQVDIGIDAQTIRNAVSYYDDAPLPSPSENEPNPAADDGDAGQAPQDAGDTFTTATVIGLPHTEAQDVGGADPADVYAFTPSQTTELSATVRDPSDDRSPPVELILHVPDGMGEGSSGTAEELTITRNVTAGKTYYLEIQPENGGGAYELDLQVDTAGLDEHGDSAASATALKVGDRPRGELFPAADQDWYAVELQARQTYTFSTYSAGQVHPDLTLVRPDGATEVVSREASDGLERVAEITHQPLASGTYYLRVDANTPNESGVYTLFTEASEDQPSGPSIDLSTADGRAKSIAAVYVAYYDRAPDPSGLAHWVSELDELGSQANYREALTVAANGFAGAQETREVYTLPGDGAVARSDLEAFVSSVYDHIFGRAPEEAGLQYWSDRLADGTPPGRMVLEILLAAEGDDVAAIDNKIAAGLAYTDLLKNGDAEYDITIGREVIDRAGSTAEALEAAKGWAQEQVETAQNQQALAIETTLGIEPETAQPGDKIEPDIVVRNIGDVTAEYGYVVTYFLSEDQSLDAADRELAEDDDGFGGNFGIEPGQEQGFEKSFEIPENVNTGDYNLLVEIQTPDTGTDVSWLRSVPLSVSDPSSTPPGSGTGDSSDGASGDADEDTSEDLTTWAEATEIAYATQVATPLRLAEERFKRLEAGEEASQEASLLILDAAIPDAGSFFGVKQVVAEVGTEAAETLVADAVSGAASGIVGDAFASAITTIGQEAIDIGASAVQGDWFGLLEEGAEIVARIGFAVQDVLETREYLRNAATLDLMEEDRGEYLAGENPGMPTVADVETWLDEVGADGFGGFLTRDVEGTLETYEAFRDDMLASARSISDEPVPESLQGLPPYDDGWG